MLTRVLLHVVESAHPVNSSMDRSGVDRRVEHMQNRPVLLVDRLDDSAGSEASGVVGLAAGCWIEGGAIENGGRPAVIRVRHLQDGGVEVGRIRLGVVDALGHGRGAPAMGSGMPASAKPRARSRQLSHVPQGRPAASGE